MKIYFHGATVDVTRSAYHVVTKHASVLVDCGMFQAENKRLQRTYDSPNSRAASWTPYS